MEFLDKNIVLSIVLVVVTFIALRISKRFLNKIGKSKEVTQKRIFYISKSINLLIVVIAIAFLAFIWSVSLDGLLVFASSIFAIIGVALFAQWSILSNLTSSVIIFFSFPSRVGDHIKILDGDNSVEGKIIEIALFHIQIKDENGSVIIYPNNLFIQRPVIKISK
jgi:small-conductance mechanosensitive channel